MSAARKPVDLDEFFDAPAAAAPAPAADLDQFFDPPPAAPPPPRADFFSMQTLKDFGHGIGEGVRAIDKGLSQVIPLTDEFRGGVAAAQKVGGNLLAGRPLTEGAGAAYDTTVNADRAANEQAAKDRPALYHGSNILGSLALPGAAGLVKGAGVLANVARAAAPVLEAGAVGLGASTADTLEGRLADAGSAAKFAGAAGAVGATVGKAAKYLSGGIEGNLKTRILNELAEGDGSGKATSKTQRAKLDNAGEALVTEAVHGPDAKAVREAFTAEASEGRKILAPIVDRIGRDSDQAYEAFHTPGKEAQGLLDFNLATYQDRLQATIKELAKEGKARLIGGIEAYANSVKKFAAKHAAGEPISLEQLRGLTTDAQGAASSAIGSLNEHGNAMLFRRVSAAASEAMDDTLSQAAQGNVKLEAAADKIRENNRRMFALLTADDALKFRAKGDSSQRSVFVRGAEKLGSQAAVAGAAGGITAAVQDPEHTARNVGLGIASGIVAKSLPGVARAIDRGVTTRAIDVAAGRATPLGIKIAERLARTAGRAAGRDAARTQDDEKKRNP
jgi:hypothetical protein